MRVWHVDFSRLSYFSILGNILQFLEIIVFSVSSFPRLVSSPALVHKKLMLISRHSISSLRMQPQVSL